MPLFSNKVVVITGGGSGIGQAIAKKFDLDGAKIVIFGRNKAKLEKAQKDLKQAVAVTGDVSNLSDLEKLFKITQNSFGGIDVLVANAGIASRNPVHKVNEAYFDEMVNINFKGVYFTVQKSIPLLNANASVVLISSMACHAAWPEHSVYSASKAAVSMLAKNFSADLIKQQVRVNAISPGYTDTGMYDKATIREKSNRIPIGQFAKPEEIAEAVRFLSSPEAKSIVGIDLVIDGGFTTCIND